EAQEQPTRETVRALVLVSEASERVGALAPARSIPLRIADIPEDLVVLCDPVQVVGPITNLLDNAVKYSDPGNPVEVSGEAVDGRLVIRIVDHGIGIPSRDLERIIARLYRVDQSRQHVK